MLHLQILPKSVRLAKKLREKKAMLREPLKGLIACLQSLTDSDGDDGLNPDLQDQVRSDHS